MDLSTTNIWLALIAVATVSQSVALIVGAVVVARRLQRAESALAAVTTDLLERAARAEAMVQSAVAEVRPVASKMSSVLDELADLSERARRAEADVRSAFGHVSTGLDLARSVVAAQWSLPVGLARGVAAGLRIFRARRAARDERQDAMALSRFANEGGTTHD